MGPAWPAERAGRGRYSGLDGVADRAEDLAHLLTQEDQGDDRHDRDEGEDQRVLRETLAFLVVPVEEVDECQVELDHAGSVSPLGHRAHPGVATGRYVRVR